MVSVFSPFAGGSARRYTADGSYNIPTNTVGSLQSVLLYNASANLVYFAMGPVGVTATVPTATTNGSIPVPPGQQVLLNFTGPAIGVLAATGTPDLYVTYGAGA